MDQEDILSRASTSVFDGQPYQDMTEGSSMIPERTQIQLGSGLSGMDQVSEPMANTTCVAFWEVLIHFKVMYVAWILVCCP